jgi:hypothetical protein
VETAFRTGAVRVLAATTTLAAGVNLPAARVILKRAAPALGHPPPPPHSSSQSPGSGAGKPAALLRSLCASAASPPPHGWRQLPAACVLLERADPVSELPLSMQVPRQPR